MRGKQVKKMILFFVFFLATGISLSDANDGERDSAYEYCPGVTTFLDADYGGEIRQIRDDSGHEHNIYYHRNPWNADESYMVGVRSDLNQQNWQVALYTGDGCYIRDLYPVGLYSWQITWDKINPKVFYTRNGGKLYKYNVERMVGTLLKNFYPLALKVNAQSLNQDGSRILIMTSDNAIRTYALPGMTEEIVFTPTFGDGYTTDYEDIRYVGYLDYICVNSWNSAGETHLDIYDGEGNLFHQFAGEPAEAAFGGHFDFSPDGKLGYFQWLLGNRGAKVALQLKMVNIDGTGDTILYSSNNISKVQNLHISWPDNVTDWYIASLFPSTSQAYTSLMDEIIKVNIDATTEFLARSHSNSTTFWAQPNASPSASGSRVNFNSIKDGTVDINILTR